ncbi:MAG: hypothetical protein K5880_06950 [Hydrogenophaga sp.]|uniref:hypothetical protein n=1 Tax=Hydrogenophaga sp. TaxID=1904254 RepID=UPI002618BF1A|nr:hypothetical protein [Hydrogenophaga sp.]MCV0438351.1 hypothetical protein [Hydrogenophaga sp.]
MWSDIDGEDLALLVALVLATVAALLDTVIGSVVFKALKILGLILSLGLAIHRIRTGKPYIKDLVVGDWKAVGQRYQIRVPRAEHGRGRSPRVLCLVLGEAGGYAECFTGAEVNDEGDVFVVASEPGSLRLDIRKS